MIPLNGTVSEVYHAQKWQKDVDRHILSPMYDAGGRHYYINELARLKDGNYVIPVRWLEDNDGIVFADVFPVAFNAQVQCLLFQRICVILIQNLDCRQRCR